MYMNIQGQEQVHRSFSCHAACSETSASSLVLCDNPLWVSLMKKSSLYLISTIQFCLHTSRKDGGSLAFVYAKGSATLLP
ncbi:unnamed protein product [Victoria cruziana]